MRRCVQTFDWLGHTHTNVYLAIFVSVFIHNVTSAP